MARKDPPHNRLAFALVDPPGKEPWYRSVLTDHNGDFDAGAILVCVVVGFMCCNGGYDTIIMHRQFDPEKFGIGIAAVLTGFAAYKWGDSKRAPLPGTTVTTATQTIATGGDPPLR